MRLRILWVAAALLSSSLMARADSYATVDLTSTYTGGGTIDGMLTLDTTNGRFSGADLTASGFGAGPVTLTDIVSQMPLGPLGPDGSGAYQVEIESGMNELTLYLPPGTLEGDIGSPICSSSAQCVAGNFGGDDIIYYSTSYTTAGDTYDATSGSLEPGVVSETPEPASLLLLGTGLLGLAGLGRRRFAWRRAG